MKIYLSQSYEAPSFLVSEFHNFMSKYNFVEVVKYNHSWDEEELIEAITNCDMTCVILPEGCYNASGNLKLDSRSVFKGIIGKGIFTEIITSSNVMILEYDKSGNINYIEFDFCFDDLSSLGNKDYRKYAEITIEGCDSNKLSDLFPDTSIGINSFGGKPFENPINNSSVKREYEFLDYGTRRSNPTYRRIIAFRK